jgi:hypothetical protein
VKVSVEAAKENKLMAQLQNMAQSGTESSEE